jgi:hypothetical protein
MCEFCGGWISSISPQDATFWDFAVVAVQKNDLPHSHRNGSGFEQLKSRSCGPVMLASSPISKSYSWKAIEPQKFPANTEPHINEGKCSDVQPIERVHFQPADGDSPACRWWTKHG